MGYTHYWTQKRNFTVTEWKTVSEDISAILKEAQHNQGIGLADGLGKGGSSPVFTKSHILFNGIEDDSHETMGINRVVPKQRYEGDANPSWDFCKTAHKPYDTAVTAVLCYLATVTRKDDTKTGEPIIGTEAFSVSSDGSGSDFIAGLELARKAVPHKANQLDIPMAIMQSDRWCAPWLHVDKKCEYEVHFCIDGHGYVINKLGQSHRFQTHKALAEFLDKNKEAKFSKGGRSNWGDYGKVEPNIWNATGSFDQARHVRIMVAQTKVLRSLFPVNPEHAEPPPAYVRPGEMPDNGGRSFCYYLDDILKLANSAAA